MNNRNLKILVVEDSQSFATFYKSILELNGHHVVVANDGKTELELYEKELKILSSRYAPFDLIISDNSMPEMNGIDAGKKILGLVPTQKFFFVTSEKNSVLKSFDVDGKNIDVEQKPISTDIFLKKIAFLTQK